MMSSKVLKLLLFVSSMTSKLIGMLPAEKVSIVPSPIQEIGNGIAQRIEELPTELKYKIFSYALALLENQKYEVYRKLDVGSRVTGIALNADNTRALTGSEEGVAHLWDVETGKLLKEFKGHKDTISSVALSTDGTLALTGSRDGTAKVWNIYTELITTLQVGLSVYSVALSANETLALIGAMDGILRLYNTSTGEFLKALEGHTRGIASVTLSADGTLALTGSWDGTARVWNMNRGELLKTLPVNSSVHSVALSAHETIAVTGDLDNRVLIWDIKTGALLNRLLTGDYIYSVALSKNSKRVFSSTNNSKIQVWNIKPLPGQKETNIPLTELTDHTDSVTAVVFGNADFIASGSSDKTVIIWKPFALEPRDPQEHEEVLWQAYKETFSKPKFLFPDETKQA